MDWVFVEAASLPPISDLVPVSPPLCAPISPGAGEVCWPLAACAAASAARSSATSLPSSWATSSALAARSPIAASIPRAVPRAKSSPPISPISFSIALASDS